MTAGSVTYLFSDLAGLAGEGVRRSHYRLFRDAIASGDGPEIRLLGDGVLAVFEEASEALGAAVAVQRAADRKLALRVGLNIGEPIRTDEDYYATAIDVARRLCARADSGEVVASAEVREAAGSESPVPFRELSPLTVPGVERPVAACEVVWRPYAPEPPELPPSLRVDAEGGFVGREQEVAHLEAVLEQCRAGQRRLVMLAGEPGIGKTRLAAEIARLAHRSGATVLFGRCHEEALLPYQPFVEALRQYVAACSDAELRARLGEGGGELGRLVPALADRFPDLPEPVAGDPEGERFRLFEAFVSLLAGAARPQHAVLVLDDLHWGDRPTLLLLAHIVRAPEESRLLILGTYRETELGQRHALGATVVDLRQEQLVERIRLNGLGESDVEALIRDFTGRGSVADLAHAVHEETEGNPFFVGEVLRHMAESGADDLREIGIPEEVRDAIARRLARLSETTSRMLPLASVIGRRFELAVLEALEEVPAEELPLALEEAVRVRIVEEDPGSFGRYRFAHALIRDTLYDGLTSTRRLLLHRRIAAVLEDLYGDDPEPHLAELAYHFLQAAPAGDVDKAVAYAVAAAQRATLQLAHEEAAAQYERALQVVELGEPDDVRRCDLMLALGEAQMKTSDVAEARETLRQAAEIARGVGSSDRLARAALAFPWWPQAGVVDWLLVGLLEEAIEAADERDTLLRVRLLARLSMEIWYAATPERQAAISREALELARRIGDRPTLAAVLSARRYALWGPETLEERQAVALELLEIAAETGQTEMTLQGHGWRIGDLLETGDIAAVDAEIEAYRELAQALRRPLYIWWVQMYRTMRALLDGRLADAERQIQELAELGQRTGDPAVAEIVRTHLFALRADIGGLAELEPVVQAFTAENPSMPAWRVSLAYLYSDTGRLDDAREHFEMLAPDDFRVIPRDPRWMMAMTLLSVVCASLGDAARARSLYDHLLPAAGRNVVVTRAVLCLGSADYPLGVLAATMSRWEDAERHFEDALAMNTKIGARPWIARVQCDHGRMLLARDAPGDRERAAELLRAASETADEIGMAVVSRRARDLAVGLRG